jgi:hypothetical protein
MAAQHGACTIIISWKVLSRAAKSKEQITELEAAKAALTAEVFDKVSAKEAELAELRKEQSTKAGVVVALQKQLKDVQAISAPNHCTRACCAGLLLPAPRRSFGWCTCYTAS